MKIVVSGTSCNGKTTFINDFMSQWPMYKTPEKTYRDKLVEGSHSMNSTEETQWMILNDMIDSLTSYEKGDKVIFDRGPIDNLIYTMWLYNADKVSDDFVKKCIPIVRESLRLIDIIFYIPIFNGAQMHTIEPRKLRETDQVYVKEIANLFEEVVRQYYNSTVTPSPFFPKDDTPPFIEIFGGREARIYLAQQYLDNKGELIVGDGGSSIFNEAAAALYKANS